MYVCAKFVGVRGTGNVRATLLRLSGLALSASFSYLLTPEERALDTHRIRI
jgi:hypothetical protein